MAVYIWHRTVNFFIPIIQESYTGAETIIDFTDKALFEAIADPDILTFYNVFHPLKLNYSADYLVWSTLRSGNPGNTLGVTQLLEELSGTYIREWDQAIQVIYKIKTTQYKTLFPHHRTPFQSGKTADRVSALEILIAAIGSDASLAAIKALITTFLGLLTTAIGKQSGQINSIDTALTNLDASRLEAADGLLYVYGSLLAKYFKIPITVDNFFAVPLLHGTAQMVFNKIFKINKPKKICSRKMDIVNDSLKFTVVGDSIIYVFYTNGIIKTHIAGTPMITLAPNSISAHNFAEAGYTDTNRFMYMSSSAAGTTSVKIEIL